MRFLLLSLAPLVLSMLSVSATKAANGDPQTVILAHVRLIDGTGAPAKDNMFVAIRDGRIVGVTKAGSDAPASARVIDYSGKTVMPGLINAHGHLALVCGTQNSATCYTKDNVIAELRQYERYGVTSMLSLGVNRDLIYEVREEQRGGDTGWCDGVQRRSRHWGARWCAASAARPRSALYAEDSRRSSF
jgi:hypothetical protein